MDIDKMAKLGNEVGAAKKTGGPGRPAGVKAEWESPRNKDKKWLEKEISRHRNELRELREFREKALSEKQVDPRAVGADPAGPLALDPALWGIIPALGYDYLAGRFGDYWKLSEREVIRYGEVTERLANKYLGSYVEQNPELAAFIMVATVTTIPRTMQLAKDLKNGTGRTSDNNGTRTKRNRENELGESPH